MCLNQSGAPNMSCKSVILSYILILYAVFGVKWFADNLCDFVCKLRVLS